MWCCYSIIVPLHLQTIIIDQMPSTGGNCSEPELLCAVLCRIVVHSDMHTSQTV